MNPYTVLRVPKTAKEKAITRAYRRRALETHPDRGGSRKAFEEVHLAYRVLMDAGRRKKFDTTGTVDPTEPDNTLPRTLEILSECFLGVIGELLKQGRDPKKENVLDHIKATVDLRLSEMAKQRREMEKLRDAIRPLVERVTVAEGNGEENFFEQLVSARLAVLDRELGKLDQCETLHKEALKLLKKFRYRQDVQAVINGWAGWALPTGATIGSWFQVS